MFLLRSQFLFAALVASSAGAGPAIAERVFVDFDSEPNSPAPSVYYNNLGSGLISSIPVALLDENQAPSGLTFDYNRPTASIGFQNQDVLDFFAPTGLDLEPFGGNLSGIQSAGHELAIAGLTPGAQYDIWMLTWAYRESFRVPMDFAITGAGDWTTLATPEDSFLAINGELGTTSRTFDSYARRFTAEAGGQLSFSSTTGEFTGVFGFLVEPVGAGPVTGSAQVTPSADGYIDSNGGAVSFDTTGTSMVVQRIELIPLDRRMMMEFALDSVPDGAAVTSATLELQAWFFTSSGSSFPTLELYGYDGDGVVTLGDTNKDQSLVGVSNPITENGIFEVILDAQAINALIDGGADYLGLLGLSGPTGEQLGVYSSEAGAFGPSFTVPTLTLNYALAALLEGDLNGDGFVSQADLDLVLLNWGDAAAPAGWQSADPFDGQISQNELDLVLLNWGNGTPPSVNAIPEPTVAVWFLAGLGMFTRRRRSARDA